jgi:sugar lactone lactonase YvrE
MTFNLPTPPQFAGAFFKRLSRIACSSLMLLALAVPLPAVDILYVTMNDNTIVSFDTTGNNGSTIAATKAVFTSSNLFNPQGLAFDSSGNLYAANPDPGGPFPIPAANTISKFNASGGYVSNITSNLSGPKGLAFDSTGNLYAANDNNTISKFNASGGYVSNITSNLDGPFGLAFDSSDNLYAANLNISTISKFNASGGYVSNITSNLNTPLGLAFDSTGNLYAGNIGNSTISKFNASGGFLSSIGSNSNLNIQAGLAFDSTGNLYAANSGNNTISKFNSSGTFLTSWSTGSAGPNYLAFKPVTVPEPSTYALATIATGVMAYLARRRKARTA